MKFIIDREDLLNPLQKISGSLLHNSTLPILNYLLLKVIKNYLLIIVANFEIEIISKIKLIQKYEEGSITIHSKKFFNICRSLSPGSKIIISTKNKKIIIKSEKSYFFLSTLPPSEFPVINIEKNITKIEFNTEKVIKELIELTYFSMANQDIRHYLNGMFLKITNDYIKSVTTDGHRLSICTITHNTKINKTLSIIIPRKGIIELFKILKNIKNNPIKLNISNNNIRIIANNFIFTSKLIDGSFPHYKHILPKNNNIILEIDTMKLKNAITRVSILSNEKFRGIRMNITKNNLKITSNNSNQEEAEETLDVVYNNKDIEICLNSRYILDILNTLKCEKIKISLINEYSSVQIENVKNKKSIYIVMPMKL
ncbi:MAG: beta sliding clamp [Candidatus Westeberhardia cardiocondylae]|nr:beta sliding clamp [Candidatus Westeberhardia cardiocondylae]